MNVHLKMPDLSTTEGTDITIAKWLVEVGQPVKRGQPLLEVETDKAVQEVECIVDGTLRAIHAAPGDEVPVGQLIATIETA
jgi:pyruvate/2-oxoglutarate dehydrogenase complex dihydrolipoamide acyltransferase (E2) component